ncbi:hypothetical protein [Desulforapulum autotrophicum]|uniref:hypothetical protein n=1 Tax=Desulforapulum autotrophicum TaxID=2296 RepID=UPI001E519A09|nr:hypothetical protein [Desulforapulum autotrophicum]
MLTLFAEKPRTFFLLGQEIPVSEFFRGGEKACFFALPQKKPCPCIPFSWELHSRIKNQITCE